MKKVLVAGELNVDIVLQDVKIDEE